MILLVAIRPLAILVSKARDAYDKPVDAEVFFIGAFYPEHNAQPAYGWRGCGETSIKNQQWSTALEFTGRYTHSVTNLGV